jgi:hypothetical protein
MNVERRFWQKVDKSGGPDACWPWQAKIDNWGYGVFSTTPFTSIHASRYAYILTNSDPGKLLVLHKCDNPSCCNPSHLFLGTNLDNSRDKFSKGRQRFLFGNQHPQAKLTEEQVIEILSAYENGGITQRELAEKYGVEQTVISGIVLGKTWSHITGKPKNVRQSRRTKITD